MTEATDTATSISEGPGGLDSMEDIGKHEVTVVSTTTTIASNADAANATTTTTTIEGSTSSQQQHQDHPSSHTNVLSPKSSHSRTSDNRNNNNSNTKKHWTDTNSDKHCIQNTHNIFARLGYSISLATGFYAVEPLDKRLSLVLGYALLAVFVTLIYIFVQGFRDGLIPLEGSTDILMETTEDTTEETVSKLVETVVETATAAAEQIQENITELTAAQAEF